MDTIVLLAKNEIGKTTTTLCLRKDYQTVKSEGGFENGEENAMSETMARTLHYDAYIDMIKEDPAYCLSIWIDHLHGGEREDLHLDGNSIFTNSYIININDTTISICLLIGCDALEIAQLILLLKDRLHNVYEVEVNTTVNLVSPLCAN
jgi:hypothetical protein